VGHELERRSAVRRGDGRLLRVDVGAREGLRARVGAAMPLIYVVGGVVSLGLLVYLVLALLKPELFS